MVLIEERSEFSGIYCLIFECPHVTFGFIDLISAQVFFKLCLKLGLRHGFQLVVPPS